ncbi:homoserine kinase [Saprospiraceae bacterium]|nr:homoserine kinase [Saprospiraceae bacterium]
MKGLRVYAPATVANVACGYDVLGFAIDKPGDEVVVKYTSEFEGLRITRIIGDRDKKLPKDISKNTAGVSAQMLLDEIGYGGEGIEMHVHKKMPFGTGMGSSSASAVAGVFAVNELLRRPFTRRELLRFAIAGEKAADGAVHGDNVAPCLMGGMVLVRDAHQADAHRIFLPTGLHAVVLYPAIEILTKDSRAILSGTVPLDKHIQQSANLAAMIMGFSRGDLDLVARSMKDVIIEPQRAKLIPHFYEVQKAAYEFQALGCSISGAGPSIFALFPNSLSAEKGAKAMKGVYVKNAIANQLYVSPINNAGAVIV